MHIELDVPERIAAEGGSVTATYFRMQRADSWTPSSPDPGVIRVQDIADVRILPGTRTGDVLRERGLGDAGVHGGTHGDLIIRVEVVRPAPAPEPPPPAEPEIETTVEAIEDDGTREVDITVAEALLGARVEVATPQGRIRLRVPPCTSSGTTLRLRGKGPDGPDGQPTDLYVTLRIVVPAELDDRSQELIEEFATLNPGDPRS